MANTFENIDWVIESLSDKIIQGSSGPMISVEDLKKFHAEVREMNEAESILPPITSFEQAKELAKRDPRFKPPAPLPPIAPALSGVKQSTREGE